MENVVEEKVRTLAGRLWESAAQPYDVACDFWLMAEQMVGEMLAAAGRLQIKLAEQPPPFAAGWLPDAVPVGRINELARAMWQAAGDHVGFAQDFWLAAERHVQTMLRVCAVPGATDTAQGAWIQELAALTPQAYLERIRSAAYQSWEAAGRQYGQALDNWLQAEQDVLGAMSAYARGAADAGLPEEKASDGDDAVDAAPPEAKAADGDGAAARSAAKPRAGRRARAHATEV